METKLCTVCNIRLPLRMFYKTQFTNKKDGKTRLASWCSSCYKHYQNKRRKRLRKIKYSKTWWAMRFYSKKDHTKKRGIDFALARDEYIKLMSEEKCFYCHKSVDEKTIDRKNNSVGYISSNCVMACKQCNSTKGTWVNAKEMKILMKLKERPKQIIPIPELSKYHWELVLRRNKTTPNLDVA